MKRIVLGIFILSPIIDYTYKLRFAEIGSIELSLNRIFKVLPIVLFILYHLATNKGFLWKKSFHLVYYISLPFSVGLMQFPSEAIDVYIRFISSFIFLFFAGRLLCERDFFIVFKSWFVISFIFIGVSFLQFFGYLPYTDFDTIGGIQVGRVSGGYEKQVAMMSYLIYTFPYAWFLFLRSNIIKKIFLTAYILAVLVIIILSTHRASIIVFFLISFYFIFMYNKKKYLLFFIPLLFLLVKNNLEYISSVFGFKSLSEISYVNFLRGRPIVWQDFVSNLVESGPLFILIGKGHPVYDSYKSEVLWFGHNEPHNDYIRIIYQYGIIGLVLFLRVLFSTILLSIKLKRRIRNIKTAFLLDVGIIIGTILFLYSFTIEPTRYPSFLWLYTAISSYFIANKNNILLRLNEVNKETK